MHYTTTHNNRFTALCPGYPGAPVPEETLTDPPSWSSNLYQRLLSTTIHSILPVQITCLAIFLHNLSPCPLWSSYSILLLLKPQMSSGMCEWRCPQQGCIRHESRCSGGLHTAAGCRAWWRVSACSSNSCCDISVACSYRTTEHWTTDLAAVPLNGHFPCEHALSGLPSTCSKATLRDKWWHRKDALLVNLFLPSNLQLTLAAEWSKIIVLWEAPTHQPGNNWLDLTSDSWRMGHRCIHVISPTTQKKATFIKQK